MSDKFVKILDRISALCLAAFSLGIVAILLIGALHAHTNVEDIELALTARDVGIFDSWVHLSITYDGRYSTNMLHGINPLVFGKVLWYKYIIIFNFLLLFAALHTATITIFENLNRIKQLLLTLVFISVFFQLNPSLAYSLYWMGSSFVYLFSCIFFSFTFSAFVLYLKSPAARKSALFPLLSLLIFVSIGFSELLLPFYSLCAIFLVVYGWKYRKDELKYLAPVAIVMLACILFMVSTPGLGLRFEQPVTHYFQSTVFSASYTNYITFLTNVAGSGTFWLLLPVFLYVHTAQSSGTFLIKRKWQVAGVLLAMLVVTYLMTLPFYLTKSYTGDMPVRVYIPVLFLLLFFLLYVLLPSVAFHYPLSNSFKPALYVVLVVTCVAAAYQIAGGKGSVGLLLSEYKNGKLADFNRLMTERYSKLSAAANSNENYKLVCVEELKDFPVSLYTHPDKERNRYESKWHKYMEAYFKIDEIRVPDDTTVRFIQPTR